jgi:hypothetical protein
VCSRRLSPPPTSLWLGRRREAGSGNDHEGEARGGTSVARARMESRDSTRASGAADCEETIERDFHRRFHKPAANVN